VCYEGRFLFEAIPTKPLKQLANFETQCEMRVDMGCIDKQHKLIYIISYSTHLGQQLHYCLTYLSKLIYSRDLLNIPQNAQRNNATSYAMKHQDTILVLQNPPKPFLVSNGEVATTNFSKLPKSKME
jgi:hypothetical protein